MRLITKKLFSVVSLFLVLFCLCQTGFAQELQVTISGTVTDQGKAAIPGATVVFHRLDTNTDERTVTTDGSGNYVATNLVPTTYTITFKAQGFSAFTAENVTVHVAQKLNLDAMLHPGSVSENVVVEASQVALQTESAAQSATITGQQVRELELNNRNFQQLVTLQPGVASNLGDVAGYGLNSTTDMAVNGVRGTANNWTVDGADINDSGSNGTLLNIPSVDAIQEFTMQRSMYDASFGRSAGGQVLVATKSGTDSFHGDLYEFVRNDKLNANTYFGNQQGDPRGIQRYNNFGFTLGGPLYIPKVWNTTHQKMFFFWSEEWRKVSSPTTLSLSAATPSMIGGTISGQVTGAPTGCSSYNANTGVTTITPSCFSANSKIYLDNIFSKYAGNSNSRYISTYSALDNFRQDIVRADYNISPRWKLYARYMRDTLPSNRPTGLWGGDNFPGVVNVALEVPGTNAVGNLTWLISPKMVNELEFAYSEGNIISSLSGAASNSALIKQLTNNWAYTDPYNRLPSVSIVGYTGVSEGSSPYHEQNLDRNLFDNFSWTLNKHTVRAGATVQWMLKSENASNGASSFSFNSWSDFLLGNVAVYSQSNRDIIPDLKYTNFEAYVQDDWKLNRRLTLNLGVRYSYFPGPIDTANTLSNFSPQAYQSSAAPKIDPVSGNFVAGQSVIPATYANGVVFPTGSACTQAKAISPLVTCSSYGSRVNPNSNVNIAPRFGFAFDPKGNGLLVIRGGYGIFYDRSLNGMWEQNAFTNPPLVQSTTVQNTSFDKPLSGTVTTSLGPNALEATGTPTLKVPSYQSYNLSLQQQLNKGTFFEIAYVGSMGRHLLGEIDLNQPTLGARAANPTANVNAVRPYVGYARIKDRISNYVSNYNSLQISMNHHITSNLTVNVAYTWSKVLSDSVSDRDTANTNTYNLKASYGPTPYNEPHIFIANYVYNLPFYKNQHGVVGHLLGGWEISGITTARSGFSSTVTQSTDPFACTTGTSGACIAGSAANTYPGGIGMGTLNSSVQVLANQVAPTQLKKSMKQWFDPSSFSTAVGQFGSGKVGTVLGPGQQNWDIGAIKNLKLAERYSLQIRGEFFNAFNHTNPSTVDLNISDSTFGQVTATHNPRNIQLGTKLYF